MLITFVVGAQVTSLKVGDRVAMEVCCLLSGGCDLKEPSAHRIDSLENAALDANSAKVASVSHLEGSHYISPKYQADICLNCRRTVRQLSIRSGGWIRRDTSGLLHASSRLVR